MNTILIIENDRANRELLDALLSISGYDTVTMETAEQALDYMKTSRPSAILLDILLPGMDGFAFTHIVRNQPISADIPIIVLTARTTRPEDEVMIRNANYDAYLQKPVTVDSIKTRLHSLLG